jgi:hypothetical protein
VQLIGHPMRRELPVHHRRCCRHHHVPGPRHPRLPARDLFAPLRRITAFRAHPYSPLGLLHQPNRR